jgi:hypothetical protein
MSVLDVILYIGLQVARVLLEKLIVPQPVKKFPAFCGSRRFIIV